VEDMEGAFRQCLCVRNSIWLGSHIHGACALRKRVHIDSKHELHNCACALRKHMHKDSKHELHNCVCT